MRRTKRPVTIAHVEDPTAHAIRAEAYSDPIFYPWPVPFTLPIRHLILVALLRAHGPITVELITPEQVEALGQPRVQVRRVGAGVLRVTLEDATR